MKHLIFCFSILSVFTLASFNLKNPKVPNEISTEGVFIFNLNGKEVIIKGAKAQFRTITGGFKQLSLSNDKFSSFVLINPEIKKIDVSKCNNRQMYLRFTEPGTDKVYKPANGFVNIQTLDLEKGVVSGEFEVVMTNNEGPEKKITLKNGKFFNVPIEEIKTF